MIKINAATASATASSRSPLIFLMLLLPSLSYFQMTGALQSMPQNFQSFRQATSTILVRPFNLRKHCTPFSLATCAIHSQTVRFESERVHRTKKPNNHTESSRRSRNAGKSGRHLPKTPIALAADTSLRRTGPSTAACTPDGTRAGGPSRLFSSPGRRRISRSKNRSRKSSPYPPVESATRISRWRLRGVRCEVQGG